MRFTIYFFLVIIFFIFSVLRNWNLPIKWRLFDLFDNCMTKFKTLVQQLVQQCFYKFTGLRLDFLQLYIFQAPPSQQLERINFFVLLSFFMLFTLFGFKIFSWFIFIWNINKIKKNRNYLKGITIWVNKKAILLLP